MAKEAGVSKATVYRYVSSKDTLVTLYAVREGRRVVSRAIRDHWGEHSGTDAAADDIVAASCSIVTAVREHPVGAKLLSDERELLATILAEPPEELAANAHAVVDLLAPLLDRAGFPDPETTVEIILRIVVTYLLVPPLSGADPDDAMSRQLRLALEGQTPKEDRT